MVRTKRSGLFQPLSGLRGHDPEDLLSPEKPIEQPPEQPSKKPPRKDTKRTQTPQKLTKLIDLKPITEQKVNHEQQSPISGVDLQVESVNEVYDDLPENITSKINSGEDSQSQNALKDEENKEKTQDKDQREEEISLHQVEAANSSSTVKRKRGRPRKYPLLCVEIVPLEQSPVETSSRERVRESLPPNAEELKDEELPVKTSPKRRGRKPKMKKTIGENEELENGGQSLVSAEVQTQPEKRKRTKSIDTESEELTKFSSEKKIKNDKSSVRDSSDSCSVFSEIITKKSDDFTTPSEYSASDESLDSNFVTLPKRGRRKRSELHKLNDPKPSRPKRACNLVTSYQV